MNFTLESKAGHKKKGQKIKKSIKLYNALELDLSKQEQ